MAIFKRQGVYWVELYVMGHRRRKKVGPNYRQARTVLEKMKVQRAEGRLLDVKPDQRYTIEEIANDFLRYSETNKRSFSRDQIIVQHLLGYFKGKKLSEITPLAVEQYKGKRLHDGVQGSTINRELAAMKCAFNWAIRSKKASENPVRQVKMFQEDNSRLRILDKDEILRLMNQSAPHLKPIVITALTTGMRRGEILGLRWADIDFGQGLIMVEKTKSGKRREIPMCALLTRTLRECFNSAPDPNGYVFCLPDGKAFKKIRTAFEAACRRAQIKDFTFHDLRHTAASYLVMNGVDLVTVKEILGHSKIEMTLRYAHLTPVHKRSAIEILGAKMDTAMDTKPKMAQEKNQEVVDNTAFLAR